MNQAPLGNRAQQQHGHQPAQREMAVPGWLEAPAGISIKGWEFRGVQGRLARVPSIDQGKLAA